MPHQYITMFLFFVQVLVAVKGIGTVVAIMESLRILKEVEMLRREQKFEQLRKDGKTVAICIIVTMIIAVYMFLFIQWGYL